MVLCCMPGLVALNNPNFDLFTFTNELLSDADFKFPQGLLHGFICVFINFMHSFYNQYGYQIKPKDVCCKLDAKVLKKWIHGGITNLLFDGLAYNMSG